MPIAITNPLKHFLIAPHAMYGHVTPATSLACNLVRQNPHIVSSLLVPSNFIAAARSTIASFDLDDHANSRLHLIPVKSESPDNSQCEQASAKPDARFTSLTHVEDLIRPAIISLTHLHTLLLTCQPVHDVDGHIVHTAIPPSVAIIDITIAAQAIDAFPPLHQQFGVEVKMLIFAPLSAQWGIYSQVQGSAGRYVGYMERCRTIMAAPPELREEAYDNCIGKCGDLIDVPGNGPCYVFETCPNQRDSYVPIMLPILESLHKWDGMVNVWPAFLGKEFQAYHDKRGIQCFQVGPQRFTLHPEPPKFNSDPTGQAIQHLLNQTFATRGPNSLLLISFGTLFYSPTARQLRLMLSVLREMDIPFILSTGGAKGDVRAVCDEMIRESSANGGDEGQKWVMADWVPQADVLAHQATGWFLTHGGSNSVLEAIRLKVPLIFWPAAYDQVQTAASFSRVHQIGLELVQVRNGQNIGRRTASGVLVEGTDEAISREFRQVFDTMNDEVGRGLRRNVERMGQDMVCDAEYGFSHEAMRRLADL